MIDLLARWLRLPQVSAPDALDLTGNMTADTHQDTAPGTSAVGGRNLARKDNNFGILRLAFATMVVVSHSAELIDGNRTRELLVQLGRSVSLGGVAVDSFFFVSGYLITSSIVRSRSYSDYLIRRLARIVPGYVTSFVACAVVLAPLVGGRVALFDRHVWLQLSTRLVRLQAPEIPGVFAGLPYPALNGSMWTIAYEARCYIIALMAQYAGLNSPTGKYLYLLIVVALIVSTPFMSVDQLSPPIASIIGDPAYSVRLFGLFGMGGVFFLFSHYIPLRLPFAAFSAFLAFIGLGSPFFSEAAMAVFGGYTIIYLALRAPTGFWSTTVNTFDISYGLYLYSFPIQNTLIYVLRFTTPVLVTVLTLPLAALFGITSWICIERSCLRFADVLIKRRHYDLRHDLA